MTDLEMARLLDAYMRRKQFESKLLAVEVWDLLGQALSQGKQGDGAGKAHKVSAGTLLEAVGQRI